VGSGRGAPHSGGLRDGRRDPPAGRHGGLNPQTFIGARAVGPWGGKKGESGAKNRKPQGEGRHSNGMEARQQVICLEGK